MNRFDVATPVVILRCSRHGALGIARTLGRLGVSVYTIDESSSAPALHSRYTRGRFIWDTDQAPALDTVAFLGEVASRIGRRPILVPTSDFTAMLVAEHAEALAAWFDFPRMIPGLVPALCSKREMYLLANRHGVPTPDTAFPQSYDELETYAERAKFPVMAKGIFGVELEKRTGKRMFLVQSRRELFDLYDSHEDWFRPNFMLQEFIPGATSDCWIFNGYFDRNSECRAEFTGRKMRQFPESGGLTSLGECAPNETVATAARQLAKACGYRGVIDMDFRFDARDGQYKVLDINPRIGATFRLFVSANGMDVVRAMYLDMTGQAIESAPAPIGRRWLLEDCDLIASACAMRDGKLSPQAWLTSYRGVAEAGIFALDDPLPAFWMAVHHARKLRIRSPFSQPRDTEIKLLPGFPVGDTHAK